MNKNVFIPRSLIFEHFFEYHHCQKRPPYKITFLDHKFYAIYRILSGKSSYIIDGHYYELAAGDFLLINLNDIYHVEILPAAQMYEYTAICLRDAFFEHLSTIGTDLEKFFRDTSGSNHRLIRPGAVSQDTLSSFYAILEMEAARPPKSGQLALAFSTVVSILVLINRIFYSESPALYDTGNIDGHVELAIEYINKHLSEKLSLSLLSKELFISSSYLSHQFKKYTGYSVYEYILKKRLRRVRALISSGSSVTSAYTECGFNDYSNFLKLFKREYGYSPSIFSKKAAAQEAMN